MRNEQAITEGGNLDGIKCPQCGHTGSFIITATASAVVEDSGVTDVLSFKWDSTAHTQCNSPKSGCGFTGELSEFEVDAPITDKDGTTYAEYCEAMLGKILTPMNEEAWSALALAK